MTPTQSQKVQIFQVIGKSFLFASEFLTEHMEPSKKFLVSNHLVQRPETIKKPRNAAINNLKRTDQIIKADNQTTINARQNEFYFRNTIDYGANVLCGIMV